MRIEERRALTYEVQLVSNSLPSELPNGDWRDYAETVGKCYRTRHVGQPRSRVALRAIITAASAGV